MNLIEYIKYVINLSDDILGDDKVVDKKERFDEAELYHVMELIQLGKFNTKELDDCIEILMNSNPSKTENDRTGDTIIYLNNVKEGLKKINKSKETMQYIKKQCNEITQNNLFNKSERYIVDVDYVKELFSNINSDDIGLYNFIEQFKGSYNISDLEQNNITPQLIISYFLTLDYILKNIQLKSNNKNTDRLAEFRTKMKLQYNITSINNAIDEVEFCLNGNEIDSKFEQFGLSEDEIKKQKENTLKRLHSIKNSLDKLKEDIQNIL